MASSSLAIPSYSDLLLSRIRVSSSILSFDTTTRNLQVFHWPVYNAERIKPNELREYRQNHQFLGPGCLCALLSQPAGEALVFTEAAILFDMSGTNIGDFVAACARGHCGYLVPIGKLYLSDKVPVKTYPLRDVCSPCPPPIVHYTEFQRRRPLKRTYALADLYDVPPLIKETKWQKLKKVELLVKPGLQEDEFLGLFAKCDRCGSITTRQVLSCHLEDCTGFIETDEESVESDVSSVC